MFSYRLIRSLLLLLVGIAFLCGSGPVVAQELASLETRVETEKKISKKAKRRAAKQRAQAESADDLMIVDCLLPARVRRLGTRSNYLEPRKPIRTSAADCRIRGGEHTAPDAANYETSLRVWLPEADAGNPEAQFYVAQIYEKGLGTEPDFAKAAAWYERSADKGYGASQVALGYLYEQGLGVEQDPERAISWYRKAAGALGDVIVLDEADYAQLLRERELLAERTVRVGALEEQVGELKSTVANLRVEVTEEAHRKRVLESLLSDLEDNLTRTRNELTTTEKKVKELEQRRRVQVEAVAASVPPGFLNDVQFGRYRALVIGNAEYQSMPGSAGAVEDAQKVATALRESYGFEVNVLTNATRLDIMGALNDLRETLTGDDNLLVYYAGHGVRDEARNRSYWQPVDADPEVPTNWIPDTVLADHLDLIPAKHIMVVADSPFAGLRTRSSVARLNRGRTEEQQREYLRELAERRSRLVLTSGGRANGSSFADAFISVLEKNAGDQVLESSRVYQELSAALSGREGAASPEFATLRWSRGGVSEFLFVPRQ